jgi:hypothetical protein
MRGSITTSWKLGRQARLSLGITALVVATLAAEGENKAADPEELIRQGIDLRRSDRDADALQLFQRAYEIQKVPKALAQIGLAEQALGKWGAADRHLRQAIESIDDAWILKNRAAIDGALKMIGSHVGRLDVRGSPAGADVRLDAELIGQLPLPGPVSVTAGGIAIEVRAPGYFPIARSTTVAPGHLIREAFSLQSQSPTSENAERNPSSSSVQGAGSLSLQNKSGGVGAVRVEPRPQGPESSSTTSSEASGTPTESPGTSTELSNSSNLSSMRPIVALGAAGLALVTLTLGIVEHGTWQNKVSSFEKRMGCDPSLEQRGAAGCGQLYDDGRRAKTFAFVGYGLTAGLVATAAIVYFTDPGSDAAPKKVACAVSPMPNVTCVLRF